MNITLECEQKTDGRWIAEVPELPGVLAYGQSSAEAMAKAEILALRGIADRLDHGEAQSVNIRFPCRFWHEHLARERISYYTTKTGGTLHHRQLPTAPTPH